MALEHSRFPEVFIIQTKKAFISFVSPEILEIGSVNFDFALLQTKWNRRIKHQSLSFQGDLLSL
jgi:hypothetical protein